MSRLAILIEEIWINPESCTQERDIALADLKKSSGMGTYYTILYSRAMKTQHKNVHQYLNDILNILSQRIYGDFYEY